MASYVGDIGCGAGLGYEVARQPPVSGTGVPYRDRGLADAGRPGQGRLDLARLHTESTDLDLLVVAREVFEPAVSAVRTMSPVRYIVRSGPRRSGRPRGRGRTAPR